MRVDLKVVCQEVVHWFYRAWPDLSIDISAGMKGPPCSPPSACVILPSMSSLQRPPFSMGAIVILLFLIFFCFGVFHVFSLHLCFFLSLVYFFVSFQRFLRIYDFPFNWLRILLISV